LYSLVLIDLPTTDVSTLSLHDALPIFAVEDAAAAAAHVLHPLRTAVQGHVRDLLRRQHPRHDLAEAADPGDQHLRLLDPGRGARSEEHTSELQSRENLVCRLLLEKKKH